jgi:hypothetical protein
MLSETGDLLATTAQIFDRERLGHAATDYPV